MYKDNPIRFIINHWQGKLPLWVSLWVIFIALTILISFIEPQILKHLFPNTEDRIRPTLISLIITRLIIFPWQLIGLVRASDNDYIKHGHTFRTRSIQILMVLATLFTMVYSIESIQNVFSTNHSEKLAIAKDEPLEYKLRIQNHGQQLLISGVFQIGITESVKRTIKNNPKLTSVSLESIGGQIYEGRGLSKLFSKLELDTYVYKECSSACATAFIGGKKRYLGKHGKIGFHQYKQDTLKYPKAVPFHNLVDEQEQDLQLFKSRGVQQTFLDKAFQQSPDGIWFPTPEELLNAGIIHKIRDVK